MTGLRDIDKISQKYRFDRKVWAI